ncbi:MAG TPA: pilus assembly protein TadG-related protein [Bradyrhizobium sp.]|nr:pilus assembly protein TadG-related protein [Bradyrhizobium sp.]
MAKNFWTDRAGSVGLLVGIAFPVLVGAAAIGNEYSHLVVRRSNLQQAADSAALAAAQQLKLANTSDAVVTSIAKSTALANMAAVQDQLSVDTQILQKRTQVQVTLSDTVPLSLGRIIGMNSVAVKATATAQLFGPTGKLCMLALDTKQSGTLHLEKNSQVTANDCVVYSNSRDKQGLQADDSAGITASMICTVGGYKGDKARLNPIPTTDCPSMTDPLASRPRPTVGSCTSTLMVVTGVQTLYPGVYCGGLTIKGSAKATLAPGNYIMNNGPLIVQDNASLIGQSAGIYFTGDQGGLRFDPNTTISLTAPKDGVLAGFIFFEDRTVSNPVPPPPGPLGILSPPPPGSPPMRQYQISSNNAQQFLGTFYLPAGRLTIDANKPVAAQSAYTVVITRQIDIKDGPNLILNRDYASTDVPVPDGVGNATQKARLAQ